MGLIQFRRLWGEKVIVERRNRDIVVGTLSGEDGMFIYLEKRAPNKRKPKNRSSHRRYFEKVNLNATGGEK